MDHTQGRDGKRSRIQVEQANRGALAAMLALERYVRGCGLEHALLELVKLRASYLNGCAHCVDMHAQDALAAGEQPRRLAALPVWRETPFFTARERAALAWTEAVTELGREGVPDALYDEVRAQFSEAELVDLSMAIIAINGWNRLAVPFRAEVGAYRPGGPRGVGAPAAEGAQRAAG